MDPDQQPSLKESSPQKDESTVVRIALYPSQARALSDARDRTGGISGVLCTVNQAPALNDGRLLLELQAARLDGSSTRKIEQLILDSRKEQK